VELVDFALVLLPFLAFTFLIMDISWCVYQKATLQYAVSQGVRYAITGRVMTGMGQLDSIRTTVQNNAMGQLGHGKVDCAANPTSGWCAIQVYFVDPNGNLLPAPSGSPGPASPNQGPNLVQVYARFQSILLAPIPALPYAQQIVGAPPLAVAAWDRMETQVTPPAW
jgi:hypothetical protein